MRIALRLSFHHLEFIWNLILEKIEIFRYRITLMLSVGSGCDRACRFICLNYWVQLFYGDFGLRNLIFCLLNFILLCKNACKIWYNNLKIIVKVFLNSDRYTWTQRGLDDTNSIKRQSIGSWIALPELRIIILKKREYKWHNTILSLQLDVLPFIFRNTSIIDYIPNTSVFTIIVKIEKWENIFRLSG